MKTFSWRRTVLMAFGAVIAVSLIVFLANLGGSGGISTPTTSLATISGNSAEPSPAPSSQPTKRVPKEKFGLPVIRESQLPPEGRETLELIRDGGPYPYDRDGANFGNFEGLLPKKRGGFYAEYTVPTPGEDDRGARRIVVGDDGTKFYTDDHYESFSYIQEGA